mgnify:CR=1 FL=1
MKAVETALYSRLSGYAVLTAALGGARIYNRYAPPGTARPYVVFFHAGGGPENTYPGGLESDTYMVKAVADSVSAAATIDEHIKAALHAQESNIAVTGYTTLWVRRTDEAQTVEVAANGDLIWHYGAYYRVRIDN